MPKFLKAIILHLRLPFSYFLLPVFLATLNISPNFNETRIFLVFIILHFFLYPASNAYNSYFDKDESSIGGLKNPPPVNIGVYYSSLALDGIAILLAYRISLLFAIMIFTFGLASKAYSHPSVRIKKMPVTGLFFTGIFQGFFTVLSCYIGLNDFDFHNLLQAKVLFLGLWCTLMLMANYPLTQIYQHKEDAQRGDRTFSLMLGVTGTFYFAFAMFPIAVSGFTWFFLNNFSHEIGFAFLIFLIPAGLFLTYWFNKTRDDPTQANYKNLMWMILISSTSLNVFFIYAFLKTTQVLQVFSL